MLGNSLQQILIHQQTYKTMTQRANRTNHCRLHSGHNKPRHQHHQHHQQQQLQARCIAKRRWQQGGSRNKIERRKKRRGRRRRRRRRYGAVSKEILRGRGLFDNIKHWFVKNAIKLTPLREVQRSLKPTIKKKGWKKAKKVQFLSREFWRHAGVPRKKLDPYYYYNKKDFTH